MQFPGKLLLAGLLTLAASGPLALVASTFENVASQRRARASERIAAEPVMMPWVIPAGAHYFNAPLVIEDKDGVVWRGYGSSKVSRIVYNGPPTKAVITLIGCTRCRLQDFEVCTSVPGVEYGVLICNKPEPNPNGRISTGNVVENVRVMHGGYPTAVTYAFGVNGSALGGSAFNNEHHRFVRCYAQSFTQAGYHLNGTQAHQIVFDACIAHDAGGRRPIGLLAEDGSYFRWVNGAMTDNSTDFQTGTSEHMNVIDFHSSEGSNRFLVSGRVGGESFASVSNVRWDGQPTAGTPVVECFGPGPWTIRNSWFAGINGLCPLFRFAAPSNTLGSLDISGVMIRQHGGTVPLWPLVACPTAWDTRATGLKHQYIDATGRRTDKKVTLNTLGVQ